MRFPFLLLVPLTTCAAGGATPKAALDAYLEAEALGRYDTAHTLLSDADRDARPLEVYVKEHLAAGPIWRAVAKRTHFKLGKLEQAGDHTRIEVIATHLDMKAVEEGLRGVPTDRIETSPDPQAALYTYVEGELDRQPFPLVSEPLTYAVKQEDGAWFVWLGLDRQEAAIDAVLAARRLQPDADVATLQAAWKAVLDLPTDPGGVVAMLQEEARIQLRAIDVERR